MIWTFIRRAKNYSKSALKMYLTYSNNKDFLRWYFLYSRSLLKYRNIHNGEDCFIIGNGPSLNKMDLTPLKDHHTFGLNKIYLMFDKVDLNLSYHVAVNTLVVEQSAKEFESLRCPTFLSYMSAKNYVRPLDHVNYIFSGVSPTLFQEDLLLPMHEGYTVTYTTMQIAYYMGFKRIFLIGVDHNFSTKGAPNEKQLCSEEDQNHFAPNYFGNQQWHLPDLEASELFFRIANFQYTRNERQIFDATVDGKLQIFSKIPYEQALSLCSSKKTH